MAAPSFVDAGTGATDAGGAWTYTCQAGAAGDVYIVQILQDGSSIAVAVTGATNIEDLAGTDNAWTPIVALTGLFNDQVGDPQVGRQGIWIGRALSTSAPTISGTNSTSEDLYIRSYRFQNVSTGTTLATVIENSLAGAYVNGAATNGTIADTAVTTLGPDRLALNFVAINDDNVIADFTGETGGDWALAVAPYAESSGTDGAIGLQIASDVQIDLSTATGTRDIISGGAGGSTEKRAQSFLTGAAGTLGTISLVLSKDAAPLDNLIIEVQTDAAGVPSGTAVASTSINGTALSTTATLTNFAINSGALSAATTYWIVLSRSGGFDGTNRYLWSRASSAYANGASFLLNGGTWVADTGDETFRISYAAHTINGGSATNSDATDGWGVVGFALIGTTVVDTTYYPRHPAHDFGSVTNF